MCGICGFTGEPSPTRLAGMRRLIEHRGPDESGEWSGPQASLGIQRLRIIDLKTGQQPVTNEDGTIHLVFNGEIYNFKPLREELRARGHRFKSEVDSEVIVHLYEDLGDELVTRLRGQFAIALWDERRKRLLLARDHLGKKPLYYAVTGGQLAFASEIKALLGDSSREIDPDALADYLAYLYIPAPRTIFRQVRSLPPGHRAVWENGRLEVVRYWSVPQPAAPPAWSEAEWIERLTAKIDEAVRIRLVADVPLGAFLSGGLDSSLIVALMAKHGRVKTFTVGFADTEGGYNELEPARKVAALFGTEHAETVVEFDVLNLLPKVIWHFDQPFGNSTAPLAYLLSEFTKQHVTVALAGTGGDEQFSGYPRYLGLAMAGSYARLPGVLRERLLEPLVAALPESTNGNSTRHRLAKRLHRFVDGSGLPRAEQYISWLTYFDRQERASVLSPEFRSRIDASEPDRSLMALWPAAGDDLQRAWHVDLQQFLPFNQLEYMDKMTMARSLEGRAPFVDHELSELCASLPASLRIRGLTTKYALKKVAEAYLPHDVVHRQKVGFDAPVGAWFKKALRPFAESFFSGDYRFQLLDGDRVRTMFNEHTTGRRDHSVQLWMLLVLEAWHEMYVTQKISTEPTTNLGDVLGLQQLVNR
jgi:asparagine synthase (glutamine-hydrolysing)